MVGNISTVTSRTHERTGYPSTICVQTHINMKNILAHYIYMHPFNKIIINSSKTSQFAAHNKRLRKARTNELRYVVNSKAQNMKLKNSQIWDHVQWINDVFWCRCHSNSTGIPRQRHYESHNNQTYKTHTHTHEHFQLITATTSP